MGASVMSKNNVIQMFPDIDFELELKLLASMIEDDGELGLMTYLSVITNHLSGFMSSDEPDFFESAFRMMCAIKLAEAHSSIDDEVH